MKLQEILTHFIPSKEVKSRIQNRQILFNSVPVEDKNMDVSIQDGYWELGDFFYANVEFLPNFFNITDFFGPEPTNIESLKFITGYSLLSLSKREHYVFINK